MFTDTFVACASCRAICVCRGECTCGYVVAGVAGVEDGTFYCNNNDCDPMNV